MHEKESENPEAGKKTPDRNLGDEWADWVGDLTGYEKEINEGMSLFISVYFGALFALTIISMSAFWLVTPRLAQVEILDDVVLWAMIVVFGLLYIYALLILLTVSTGKNFMLIRFKHGLHIEWAYPLIYAIGKAFKVSKDRIGHSITKVNNALIFATRKSFQSENLLVLLPRCLSKESRDKVLEITGKYGCKAFTATGGSSARQIVIKERPDAIIGVACERDLVAGMADTPHKLPVIAIPNKRPEGPCKNTVIDLEEFEKAVKFFLKKI